MPPLFREKDQCAVVSYGRMTKGGFLPYTWKRAHGSLALTYGGAAVEERSSAAVGYPLGMHGITGASLFRSP